MAETPKSFSLDPYATKIGWVTILSNEIQDIFATIFSDLLNIKDDNVARNIFFANYSQDRAQRALVREAMATLPPEKETVRRRLKAALGKADKLAAKRNDVIHGLLLVAVRRDGTIPEHAKYPVISERPSFRGKDLERELSDLVDQLLKLRDELYPIHHETYVARHPFYEKSIAPLLRGQQTLEGVGLQGVRVRTALPPRSSRG